LIISLKWLKEYIDLDGISADEIVEKLTTSGSEVDEVVDQSAEFENIVIGRIESVAKHPDADRLSICKVSDGTDIFNVVCGAPNVAAGQNVPFAKVGAIIPNGKFEIKNAKIRGEKSFGMICAEDELGISDNHDGIMVLDDELNVGDSFSNALNYNDVILDIAITPNRADSLSHIGIARDLAAIFNRKMNYPEIVSDFRVFDKNEYAEVIIENEIGCPRYSAVVVKDIVVKESPEWLKEKLISIGSRPINNIVDVTNFVLHEMGQPLHAFDLDLLGKKKIVVKNNSGEVKFTTLDSKERSMLPTDLMICDGEKSVAIAGVMGGENSEVSNDTTNILIESAYFDPSVVRKTAKHLGLSTDASYRFERGTNPNGTLEAAIRAAQIIKETTGGEIIKDVIDVYPNVIETKNVSVRFSRIEKILGFSIDEEKVVDILTGLEFKIENKNEMSLTVSVPTFRHDIEREIDLIEEIVRIYGFDGIPPIERISVALKKQMDEAEFEDDIRNQLTSIGFNEVISNSLISDDKTINYAQSIKVLNPQSTEMSRLRTSLIPGMLLNISRNLKVKESNLRFFEIGEVFSKNSEKLSSFEDFEENENLIIAVCGNKQNTEWYQKEAEFDYYDLMGAVKSILSTLRVRDDFSESSNDEFEYFVESRLNKKLLGKGGKVNNELLDKFEISKDVYLFEINLEKLKSSTNNSSSYKSLLKYPKVYRDFGFILDKKISYNVVVKTIKDSSSKLLKNVNLFDIFESESLGADKKSLAFQLEYYDNDRTLRDEEIDAEFWKTIETVKTKLNAELRG
jgi:phenylalanyl-tRNA synthetase beta chain